MHSQKRPFLTWIDDLGQQIGITMGGIPVMSTFITAAPCTSTAAFFRSEAEHGGASDLDLVRPKPARHEPYDNQPGTSILLT